MISAGKNVIYIPLQKNICFKNKIHVTKENIVSLYRIKNKYCEKENFLEISKENIQYMVLA